MSLGDEKYLSFTTFRKNGERKSTPIWIADIGDELGFTTGLDSWKVKRLRNDPRCELQPSDSRGRVTEGSTVVTGTARLGDPDEVARVKAAIRSKYGIMATLIQVPTRILEMLGRRQTGEPTAVLIKLD